MRIKFKESTHEYFNEENEKYISVSGVAKLLNATDWNQKLIDKAHKLKIPPEQLRAEWDRKKNLGTAAGTIVHKKSELERLSSPKLVVNDISCDIVPCNFSSGLKWSAPHLKLENNKVYPELLIYDHDFKICGQADEVWVADNTISVFDIKTDKSIDTKAWNAKWEKGDRLLPPVAHLENCNYNLYSLKMSMYMYMLWKQNKDLKVGKLILEWQPILRNSEGIPILDDFGEPTILKKKRFEVPYRKKEVKEIFDYYKKGKLK